MPVAHYDASALATPVEEPPEQQRISSISSHRHSSSYFRNPSPSSSRSVPWRARVAKDVAKYHKQAMKAYKKLTPLQRVLAVVIGIVLLVLGILFLVFNERIFHKLVPVVQRWRNIPAGWLIIWFAIFVVSFPPLIGYSSLLTICGFVYGFPNSWFIAASATIVGSTCSFLVSRSLLKNMVDRLVANDPRFTALALTLKHDGIKILIMIRLCPLPYSLSNGAVATFPTVHWASFALATAISTVKLLLHVFVGSRIGELAEKGEEMDFKTKAISYLSIAIGVIAGVVTGWLVYRQTKARARELEAEERTRPASTDALASEYLDDPDEFIDEDPLGDDEDAISLHSARIDGILRPYRDESSSNTSSSSSLDSTASDDSRREATQPNGAFTASGDEEQGLAGPK